MPEQNNVLGIAGNWVSDVLVNRAGLACRNILGYA
jgi:hypothetical protein